MRKEYIKIIIFLISYSALFFGLGILFNINSTINRHKEIINERKRSVYGYDRYDLHYITFGEKIKTEKP